jgi:hypothetical protein
MMASGSVAGRLLSGDRGEVSHVFILILRTCNIKRAIYYEHMMKSYLILVLKVVIIFPSVLIGKHETTQL